MKLEYKDIQQAITDQELDPTTLTLKDIPRLLLGIRASKLNDPRQT
ncbi:hypothetical protein KKH82_04045 [Patescibacteria group bacterium]|nr:hypothetical protein [Patescibacteria group bacterium]